MKRGIKLTSIIVLIILTIQFVSAACTGEDDFTISVIDPLGQVVTDNEGDYTCDSIVGNADAGGTDNCAESVTQCLINFPMPESCEMRGNYSMRCTGSDFCPTEDVVILVDENATETCTEDDCELCCEADTDYEWVEGLSTCCGNGPNEYGTYGLYSTGPGCCDDSSKCYFDSMLSAECMDDGTYIKDILCDDGQWVSKTGLIAAQLIEEAETKSPGDYTLFCGIPQESLNLYNYLLPRGNNVFEYLDSQECNGLSGASCVNNMCVLSNSDNSLMAFGASINDEMDLDMLYDMLDYSAYCDEDDDGGFHRCSGFLGIGGNKLWYDPEYRIFIYGEEEGILDNSIDLQNIDLQESRATRLENQFAGITDAAYPQQDELVSYVRDHSKKFDSIYINKKSGKQIFARNEGAGAESLVIISYVGFTSNVCAEIEVTGDTICRSQPGGYIVASKYLSGETNPIHNNWAALTAGLRIN